MNAVEFTTELSGAAVLPIPIEVAAQLPKTGLARIIVLTDEHSDDAAAFFGVNIPVAGNAGDQQAALFGQTCYAPGTAKNTYGTGSFLLLNTGNQPTPSQSGMLTTIAWRVGDEPVEYALEGAIFITGAAVQWLRDQLGLLKTAAESEASRW